MRYITVPVYIGVMDGAKEPITWVSETLPDVEGYTWYRTTLRIPVEEEVTEIASQKVEKVE